MSYIIGDQNYDPEGMVAFQARRRAELAYWRPGSPFTGPATGSPYKRPAPTPSIASALCPMSSAPRDGTAVKLYRRAHPNLKHPVVTAYWKHFSAHHGFWYSSGLGAIGDDDFVIGWEPV